MIEIDNWIRQLEEDEDAGARADQQYQKQLFEQYVLRNQDCEKERKELYLRYKKGEPLEGKHGLRKALAAFDLSYFGRAYLSHYFHRKSPEFHEALDAIWSKNVMKDLNPLEEKSIISRMDGSRQAIAAPRGHAKSTNFTFKDTLHSVLYEYKHYPIIISDSSEQAEGFLDDIKTELEDNAVIITDFGTLKGNKCWRSGVILTSTNIKIEALGSGKKIRGRRHKIWRPDLLVLDDIENDENVNTPEQRKKLKNWFDKAVSKCGDTYTDIMYIGTILHYDSLLSNTLKNPRYDSKKYQAVITESINEKLWDAWEAIYTNLFDEKHKEAAKEFYQANKEEMLEGTEVLWEEKFTYYDLMEMKVSEGAASFNSEMQNDPLDPENATFNPEWFDYYEPDQVDFKKPEYLFVGANDPSLGKNKKSDTSSIISLAVDTKTGYMYILEASIEKRKPDVIISDIFETQRRLKRDYEKGFQKFGVETVQFQYYFKEVMAKESAAQKLYLPIEEIQSSVNKQLRIESLQPLIKNKYIKFNREHKSLLKQLEEYPMGRNDDGPDGLQMAVSIAQSLRGTTKPDYKTILARKLKFRKGAY